MTSYKVNFILVFFGKTPEYENLFSLAHQLVEDQLIFLKLIPSHLAQHLQPGANLDGKLTILAENGAIAAKT